MVTFLLFDRVTPVKPRGYRDIEGRFLLSKAVLSACDLRARIRKVDIQRICNVCMEKRFGDRKWRREKKVYEKLFRYGESNPGLLGESEVC